MSLINKMLVDLEDRQACLAGEEDVALQGLTPINEKHFHEEALLGKFRYHFIIAGIILSASCYLIYRGYPLDLVNVFKLSGSITESNTQTLTSPDISSNSISTGQEPVKKKTVVESELSSKSLESPDKVVMSDHLSVTSVPEEITSQLVLPQPQPYSISKPVPDSQIAVQSIAVSVDHKQTILQLRLSDLPEYYVYTLSDPERIVVELNNTRFADNLPKATATGFIRTIRRRYEKNSKALLVLDISIDKYLYESRVVTVADGHELNISIEQDRTNQQMNPGKVARERIEQESQTITPGSVIKTQRDSGQYYSEAIAHYKKGNITAAIDLLLDTITMTPQHIEARTLLISLLIRKGEQGLAIEVIDDGLAVLPGQSAWVKTKAQLLVNQGRTGEAIRVLQANLPSLHEDTDYHAFHAGLLQKQGQYDLAAKHYLNLVQIRPDNGIWWMGLAISSHAAGDHSTAAYAYKKALQDTSLKPELRSYISKQITQLGS